MFQVYQEILNDELEFPEWLDWDLCKEVMQLLINKSPDARVGGNIAALKIHKWFELIGNDWVSDVHARMVCSTRKLNLTSSQNH